MPPLTGLGVSGEQPDTDIAPLTELTVVSVVQSATDIAPLTELAVVSVVQSATDIAPLTELTVVSVGQSATDIAPLTEPGMLRQEHHVCRTCSHKESQPRRGEMSVAGMFQGIRTSPGPGGAPCL